MGLRPPSAGPGGAQQVFVQETAPSVAYPCIWVVTDSAGNPTGEIRAENSGAYPVIDDLGIPASLIDALGDLIVGTGNDTAARLARGTTGQQLAVGAGGVLQWVDPPTGGSGISPTIIDAKGDLIVGTANDTPARLAVGTTGQVPTAQADGSIAWATPAASGSVRRRIVLNAGSSSPFTNQQAPIETWGVGTELQFQVRADLTGFTEARLCATFSVAGAAGAFAAIQYSLDNGTTWAYLDGTNGPRVAENQGILASAWGTIVAAAQTDIVLRFTGEGGDGIADPVNFQAALEAR